jgi:hypothetical protein
MLVVVRRESDEERWTWVESAEREEVAEARDSVTVSGPVVADEPVVIVVSEPGGVVMVTALTRCR